MVTQTDVTASDGRTLHVYDAAAETGPGRAVFWLHGTPNTGAPPEPLFATAAEHKLRWVSYDRPGYGSSDRQPGRVIGDAAADVAAAADALGLEKFAVVGHSGGAPHALACAALLPERVSAVVCGAGMAPFRADGLNWFAGMGAGAVAVHRAAAAGRDALERHLARDSGGLELFTEADLAALDGPWAWLASVAGQAIADGPDGQIDDELAYVSPWGFELSQVRAPVLVLHGDADRINPSPHGTWLARRLPSARLWLRPGEGHVSVLSSAAGALGWVAQQDV